MSFHYKQKNHLPLKYDLSIANKDVYSFPFELPFRSRFDDCKSPSFDPKTLADVSSNSISST
jgi:hypothetical protein